LSREKYDSGVTKPKRGGTRFAREVAFDTKLGATRKKQEKKGETFQ